MPFCIYFVLYIFSCSGGVSLACSDHSEGFYFYIFAFVCIAF